MAHLRLEVTAYGHDNGQLITELENIIKALSDGATAGEDAMSIFEISLEDETENEE